MKKTWIKIKRGLLEPKHREKLGAAWFLYFYMLDKTNWDNGIIQEWTDESAAQELEMPLSTLRYQRRQLEDALYIQTFQKQRYLQIKINNWTNPREYSGEVYNRLGDKNLSPSEFQGDNQGYNQGDNQGDNQGAKKLTPLHIDSHITDSQVINISQPTYEPCDDDGLPIKEKKKKQPKEPMHPALVSYRRQVGRYPPRSNFTYVIGILGDAPDELFMHQCKAEWDRRGYNGNSLKWLEWYKNRFIPPQYKFNNKQEHNANVIRNFLEKSNG